MVRSDIDSRIKVRLMRHKARFIQQRHYSSNRWNVEGTISEEAVMDEDHATRQHSMSQTQASIYQHHVVEERDDQNMAANVSLENTSAAEDTATDGSTPATTPTQSLSTAPGEEEDEATTITKIRADRNRILVVSRTSSSRSTLQGRKYSATSNEKLESESPSFQLWELARSFAVTRIAGAGGRDSTTCSAEKEDEQETSVKPLESIHSLLENSSCSVVPEDPGSAICQADSSNTPKPSGTEETRRSSIVEEQPFLDTEPCKFLECGADLDKTKTKDKSKKDDEKIDCDENERATTPNDPPESSAEAEPRKKTKRGGRYYPKKLSLTSTNGLALDEMSAITEDSDLRNGCIGSYPRYIVPKSHSLNEDTHDDGCVSTLGSQTTRQRRKHSWSNAKQIAWCG